MFTVFKGIVHQKMRTCIDRYNTLCRCSFPLTLVGDGALLGAEPALGVDQLPAAQTLLAAVERPARRHQSEQVPLRTTDPRERSTA